MNIPGNILTLIAGIAITLISLWYGQNNGLLPVAASVEASNIDGLFNFMMTIATGLFFLIEGILVFSLIKFRRKKGDTTDGPAIEGNVPLEILWTSIPTVIVLFLAIYSFEVYNSLGGLDPMAAHDTGTKMTQHQQSSQGLVALNSNQKIALGLGLSPEEAGSKPLQVNVNGIQYAWIFTYPDTGVVSGELHVPINQPVQLNMEAGDVIHAFWLPELRIKQDVIPGRTSELTFTANRIGEYPVICAELCGAYHGGMKTQLYVQSLADYEQWVQDNTFAQSDSVQDAVAIKPANEKSDGEFLASYAENLGIETKILEQLPKLEAK